MKNRNQKKNNQKTVHNKMTPAERTKFLGGLNESVVSINKEAEGKK